MKSKITIKKIQDLLIKGVQSIYVDDVTSRRMWWCALEVIQKDFLLSHYQEGGVWAASPLPAINERKYLNKFKGWLWAPKGFPNFKNEYAGYLPVKNEKYEDERFQFLNNYKILSINAEDGFEPFLMIITPTFQCVLSITGAKDKKNLIMRSDEKSIQNVIELLNTKLIIVYFLLFFLHINNFITIIPTSTLNKTGTFTN